MIQPCDRNHFGKTTLQLAETTTPFQTLRTTFAGWGPRI
jgi:hypothetical protein